MAGVETTPFIPNYGTNMLPEVVLEGKQKKNFGETYVGGLLNTFATSFGSQMANNNNQQKQIGVPTGGGIKPIISNTPQVPRVTNVSQSPKPTPKKNSNTMLIVGGLTVLAAGVGAYFYISKKKVKTKKEPLSGVRGNKRKPKNKTINI